MTSINALICCLGLGVVICVDTGLINQHTCKPHGSVGEIITLKCTSRENVVYEGDRMISEIQIIEFDQFAGAGIVLTREFFPRLTTVRVLNGRDSVCAVIQVPKGVVVVVNENKCSVDAHDTTTIDIVTSSSSLTPSTEPISNLTATKKTMPYTSHTEDNTPSLLIIVIILAGNIYRYIRQKWQERRQQQQLQQQQRQQQCQQQRGARRVRRPAPLAVPLQRPQRNRRPPQRYMY